jgi:CheY-like chemotaxis protein
MNTNIPLLMADDDPDDFLLLKSALEDRGVSNPLRFVENGVELMRYLAGEGPYHDRQAYPLPGVILLDLNMPKKDGREVLADIKQNPKFKHIPVVVLSTSKTADDVLRTYQLGASCFITKPSSYEGIEAIAHMISEVWLRLVTLPCAE